MCSRGDGPSAAPERMSFARIRCGSRRQAGFRGVRAPMVWGRLVTLNKQGNANREMNVVSAEVRALAQNPCSREAERHPKTDRPDPGAPNLVRVRCAEERRGGVPLDRPCRVIKGSPRVLRLRNRPASRRRHMEPVAWPISRSGRAQEPPRAHRAREASSRRPPRDGSRIAGCAGRSEAAGHSAGKLSPRPGRPRPAHRMPRLRS